VQVCWAEAVLVDRKGTVQVGQVTHEAATKSMTDPTFPHQVTPVAECLLSSTACAQLCQ
jgi:hypothetical protein